MNAILQKRKQLRNPKNKNLQIRMFHVFEDFLIPIDASQNYLKHSFPLERSQTLLDLSNE